MSSALLIEIWDEIKTYIPPKERSHVADYLVSRFDDYGLSDGIDEEVGLDKTLKSAVASYYHLDEDVDIDAFLGDDE